jgi:hypothetical protein
MKLWPFRRRDDSRNRPERGPVVVPFPDDIAELSVLKHHGLRALSSFLMARHSACRSPHPFCGPAVNVETVLYLIAHVVLQAGEADGRLFPAIYFTRAKSGLPDTGELIEPFDYVSHLDYAEETPSRKLVVDLISDGTRSIQYGPILNPTVGDYSTGRIDPDNFRTVYCNPEPLHAKWQYWESQLTAGQQVVPEFRCLLLRGEWWIADADRQRGLAQQVAGLTLADDPNHNWGIHTNTNSIFTVANHESEYARVLDENLG